MFVFFKLQRFLLFALLFSSQLSASTVFKPLEVVASAKDFFQDIGEDIIHPVLDIFERYGKNNVMATVGTNVLEKDKIAPNNIGLKDKEKILFIFINTFINDEANVVANMFAKEMNLQSPYVDKSFGMGG